MTHPLTDKMIHNIIEDVSKTDWNDCDECEDILLARAAADWQLEQVIKWLHNNLNFGGYTHFGAHIHVDEIVSDLKYDMRPQQQEDL